MLYLVLHSLITAGVLYITHLVISDYLERLSATAGEDVFTLLSDWHTGVSRHQIMPLPCVYPYGGRWFSPAVPPAAISEAVRAYLMADKSGFYRRYKLLRAAMKDARATVILIGELTEKAYSIAEIWDEGTFRMYPGLKRTPISGDCYVGNWGGKLCYDRPMVRMCLETIS